MRKFVMFFSAVLLNCLMGSTLAATVGVVPMAGALGLIVISAVVGLPAGACAGVYTEIWTGEMVKGLRGMMAGTWLDGIPDSSSIVNNDVIHLVDVGVDPDVLINNTTYPIPLQALDDQDIAVSLDKFQTKVTPITDDELYAVSYDKMGRVKESHGNSINDAKFKKAAHALCAQQDGAKTPVLATSGTRDANSGRVKACIQDIINMKKAMDNLGVPAQGRRLVLCPDHVNDLLETEQSFKEQYNINRGEGTIGRLYGFDIYEFAGNPLYTTAGKKKAVDATAETGEFQCSFAFYVPRVFKATGSTKMYYSEASTDPEYQRNKVNFRHMFLCMPKKADAGVVIRSGYNANDNLNDGANDGGSEVLTISGADSLSLLAGQGSNVRTYATSNGAGVTAETDAAWLTVSVEGNKVTFTREAYAYDAAGSDPRTATVTIGIAGSDVTKTVTVEQAMAVGNDNGGEN